MCKPRAQFITFLVLMTWTFSPLLGQDLVWKSGTVITLRYMDDRILVAADSHESSDSSDVPNQVCKIMRLDDHTFFVAEGMDRIEGPHPYDTFQLARRAYSEVASHQLEEVATRWADLMVTSFEPVARDDLDFFGKIITPWRLAGAILGTVSDNGFELYYADVGLTMNPDPVNLGQFHPLFWKKVWPIHPADTGGISVFGSSDRKLVMDFVRVRTKPAANARNVWQQAVDTGKEQDVEVSFLRAAVQYELDNATDKKAVGGYVDILELRKGGKAIWVDAKPKCKHDLQK